MIKTDEAILIMATLIFVGMIFGGYICFKLSEKENNQKQLCAYGTGYTDAMITYTNGTLGISNYSNLSGLNMKLSVNALHGLLACQDLGYSINRG